MSFNDIVFNMPINGVDQWKTQPGRHGDVYVTPDSCDSFPLDFWDVPTTDQIVDQQSIANLPTAAVARLLGSLGTTSAELVRLF